MEAGLKQADCVRMAHVCEMLKIIKIIVDRCCVQFLEHTLGDSSSVYVAVEHLALFYVTTLLL